MNTDSALAQDTQGRQLDTAPPSPPRSKQNMMSMAAGPKSNMAMDMSNPAVQVMSAMGDARQALLKLASLVPPLAQGVQQIISGLEAVVPQMVADIVSGQPPGSSGAGIGSAQASAAPTAPPVQAGTP